MPERICSAADALENSEIDSYPLFEDSIEEKEVAIWQPSDSVDDLFGVPNPAARMRTKATEFLQTVNRSGCHLAVAPEWAYNLEWVSDHADYLFADESPLFVLGCAPMEYAELEAALSELEQEYDCHHENILSERERTFVTPTIVPIRTVSGDSGDDPEDALFIQFKNEPMGDNENINEVANMGRGEFIWTIDPSWQQLRITPLTCSDILNFGLKQEVVHYVRSNDAIAVHVQLNPHPFHNEWRRFRGEIFSSTNMRTTYIAANWNTIPIPGEDVDNSRMGYSGIYAKASDNSTLDKYDQIYCRGGLPGANPSEYYEFVWLLPENPVDDTVSVFSYQSPNPAGAGSGGPSIADLHIINTWVWNDGSFEEDELGIPECNHDACQQWHSKLPDEPLGVELISSVATGDIEIQGFLRESERPFHPQRNIRWPHISNLRCSSDEKVSHILAMHEQRSGLPPTDICEILNEAFETAKTTNNIRPMQEYEIKRLPLNAESIDEDQSVCVTVVQRAATATLNRRKDWIADWWGLVDPFRSFIVYVDQDEGMTIEEGPKHEQVDGAPSNPRSVDVSGGPMEGEQ